MNAQKLIKLSDCVVGQRYMTIPGKTIQILSKTAASARVLVPITNQETSVEFAIDNYAQDAQDESEVILMSDCVVGKEYVDECAVRIKVLRKDKQKLRVRNLATGEEQDLNFKKDYYVRNLPGTLSGTLDNVDDVACIDDSETEEVKAKDIEIAALKERIILLEQQLAVQEQVAQNELSKSQQRRCAIQEDRDDIEYVEGETPVTKASVMSELVPVGSTVSITTDSVRDANRETADMSVVPKARKRRARAVKDKVAIKAKRVSVAKPRKNIEVQGDSKKKFILKLLREDVQTRESLARALISAGLSKYSDVARVKGHVSVLLYELEKRDGVTVQRQGCGQYRVND
jgi:hypothetical protein